MKKTLTALAVLGAFAGTAVAADVTLYGKIDAGLNWNDISRDQTMTKLFDDATYAYQMKNFADEDTFGMKSGQNSGSRFGIKGTEDLGNGMTVGFVLENGFDSDTGEFSQEDHLFGRQATLFLKGGFGEIALGRVGGLSSGLGSYSKLYNYSAFSTGWSNAASTTYFGLERGRYDNMVTYVSPEFAGAKVYAQYSFQTTGDEEADSGANTRYAALGTTYDVGAFSANLVVDSVMNANTANNKEDSLGVSLGASYDFGFMKVFGLGQYGKNESRIAGFKTDSLTGLQQVHNGTVDGEMLFSSNEGMKGYNLQLGTTVPVAGGTFLAQVSYADGETEEAADFAWRKDGAIAGSAETDAKAYGVAVAYQYPLSARTFVYSFATYNKAKYESKLTWGGAHNLNSELETDITEVGFGMVHNF